MSKSQSILSTQTQNQYLHYLIDASFPGVNIAFALPFENNAHWTIYRWYLLPTVTIKDYNVMIDGKNFFDQPVKDLRTYNNIIKIATGQGDDYATGCLLRYPYF